MKSSVALDKFIGAVDTTKGKKIVNKLIKEITNLKQKLAKQEGKIVELRRQAMEDPVTGLANRRAFELELEHAISYHRRYGRPASLLLLDINNFKGINDSLGHITGDVILCHIARILETYTRDSDVVARIGGDEFCVILREVAASEAEEKARQLESIITNSPCRHDSHDISVSVSIGICGFDEATCQSELLEKADTDMYAHKISYTSFP